MESPTETIRDARPADAPRLARMRWEFRAAEDSPVEAREAFVDRCETWMRGRLESASDRWRGWVAEPGGRLRGHVWVHLFPKVPNPAEEPEAHAYLTNTYVEPAYREHGLGTALVEAAVRWCRRKGVDSLILWPTDDSRPLYRRLGCAPSEGVFELDLSGG